MGKPMARNVLKAGFPLVVHNRSRGAVDELVGEGAAAADSPAEVAPRSDVVLTCLPGPADVEKVYLGPNGIVSGSRAGLVLVDLSTIDPDTHRRIAEAAQAVGAGYLDAPVSGGTVGAREATLTIMVGGEAEVFERARPVLAAMGQRLYHVGPTGAGAVVKLINNLMVAINTIGVCEGLVLGAKAGVAPEVVFEIVSNSSGSSRTLGNASGILRGDFEPGFMVDLMHKDVNLALDLGRKLKVRLLGVALAAQMLLETQAAGLGRQNTTAQIIPLERSAGTEARARKP
ncbi:MAG: NAD(P)-dependent oxidoreductase [Chloroflexi bacterium]|nr:NAD(P)-dependent oxidoreductase [Chloroflexota bacterium]